MKLSKALQAFVEESRKSDSYWVEHAKLNFSIDLEKRLRAAKMTYAALAKKIGTSAAYITKVFRGDTNMTIETMVKLSRAAGGRLEIRIVDASSQTAHWDVTTIQQNTMTTAHTTASAIIYQLSNYAANQELWERSA